MTDISGKSLHEIYKEDARKYNDSIKLTGNFDKREALKVTIPMEEFDKLKKLALSAHTDELSVEKLQEQLNTAKMALKEIDRSRYGMQFRRDRNPNVARQALAAIGGDDEL